MTHLIGTSKYRTTYVFNEVYFNVRRCHSSDGHEIWNASIDTTISPAMHRKVSYIECATFAECLQWMMEVPTPTTEFTGTSALSRAALLRDQGEQS